jgi:hypothetical protein
MVGSASGAVGGSSGGVGAASQASTAACNSKEPARTVARRRLSTLAPMLTLT